jgi:hypothetical protein
VALTGSPAGAVRNDLFIVGLRSFSCRFRFDVRETSLLQLGRWACGDALRPLEAALSPLARLRGIYAPRLL